MSRFACVAGWVVAAILLAVLLWPKEVSTGVDLVALRAQNDSLGAAIADRDTVIVRMKHSTTRLRAYYDSIIATQPPVRIVYLRAHEEARSLPYSDKWRYMGTLAVDTAAH